ncbi:GNAT family N-acetyltransferase [Comamonas jiangduensis]|jgi:GNAT superfamily N-acetyltransferase|uniref:GNAT family N-acetyltransferase n=1 Tax=Comamonas jiangduensis TaxID=1194168 RepID=UPI0015824DF7|nr:GNAT family N-acetyltransferase [Comamonas jiangduensis]QXW17966.1 GNAT family N-acetyltransferase [Comamonas aquatica]
MTEPLRWITSPWKASKQWLRKASAKRSVPSMVPIRELSERHRARIRAHLLKLDEGDRYLRFGYAANDEQVVRYADNLNFARDDIFGIFNRRLELIAMAHLAYVDLAEHSNCAEFGVSVLKTARGLGLGTRLFARAMLHSRNKGVEMMFIHALSENTPMLKIARNAGARVKRDGTESEAYLQLPAAGLDSQVSELWDNQVAEVDYQFKKQAKQFWSILADVQEIRQGVREGRHKSAP